MEKKKLISDSLKKKDVLSSIKKIKYDGFPIWYFVWPWLYHGFYPKLNNRIKKEIYKVYVKNIERFRRYSYNKKTNKKAPILFLGYSDRLRKRKDKYFFQLYESITEHLERYNILYLKTLKPEINLRRDPEIPQIYNYCSKKSINNAIKKSKELNKKFLKLKENIREEFGSVWDKEKNKIEFLFSEEFLRYLLIHYEGLKNAIIKSETKVAITISETGILDLLLYAACKKQRVLSALVPHSMVINPKIFSPLRPDIVACYGKENKKIYEKKGINWRIKTGPIIFDNLININKGVYAKKPFLIYATQDLVENNLISNKKYKKFLEELFIYLKKVEDKLDIVIKTHPREKNTEIYKEISKKNNLKIKIITDPPPYYYPLLKSSKILLTAFSNLAVEANLLKKPVILLRPPIKYNFKEDMLEKKGAGISVRSLKKLPKIIEKIINKSDFYKKIMKKQEKFLNDFVYYSDGKSGKRFADFLYVLIESVHTKKDEKFEKNI